MATPPPDPGHGDTDCNQSDALELPNISFLMYSGFPIAIRISHVSYKTDGVISLFNTLQWVPAAHGMKSLFIPL